jgi:hypothetical protein
MNFERGKDPKDTLEIGIYQACQDLVKGTDINILSEAETRDMILFDSREMWKYHPHPHTAADFMSTDAITKSSGCHICIGTTNRRFYVQKNTGHLKPSRTLISPADLGVGTSGTLEELYDILQTFLGR